THRPLRARHQHLVGRCRRALSGRHGQAALVRAGRRGVLRGGPRGRRRARGGALGRGAPRGGPRRRGDGARRGWQGARHRERRAAFLERLALAYGDDWWFQSALAFTYNEVDRFEESRRLSERSLQQYPGNANASHNIAHICFETADTDGGAAFLEEWLAGYD